MTAADSPTVQSDIERSLASLRATFRARFEAAATEQALREENARIVGKKGELTAIMKQMGEAPAESRRAIGELANAVKQEVAGAFEDVPPGVRPGQAQRDTDLNARPFDLTLPCEGPLPRRTTRTPSRSSVTRSWTSS